MSVTRIEFKECPKCGQKYAGVPALSRDDNKTLICPDCGIRESLASLGVEPDEGERILKMIHKAMATGRTG